MQHQEPVPGNDRDHHLLDPLEPLDHLDRLTRRRMDIETLIYRLQYQLTIMYETHRRLQDTIHVANKVEREIHSISLDLNHNIFELRKMLIDNTLGQDICEEDDMVRNFLNEESQE